MTWTPDMIDLLRTLWANGRTCSQIGAAMGITRNAVIGKVHRLRIAARVKPHKPYVRAPRKPSMPKAAGVMLTPVKPVLEAPTGPGVSILDVVGCKFPIGSDATVPGTHLFCNHETTEASPWCSYHHDRVHAKAAPDRATVKRFKMPVTLMRAVA
jgi:GcrA cell cycle regulator